MGSAFSTKSFRVFMQRALFFLPRKTLVKIDRWLRGRKEFSKLTRADYVIVSLPKSGRTWLRVMLSRFYQNKFGLAENAVLGFDNFNSMNKEIPKVLFTHDNVIRDYTGNLDNKRDFYAKKVVLLVRDPRDLVVSQFHQWSYRANPWKRNLYSALNVEDQVEVFDFAMNSQHGVLRNINFLNGWQSEHDKMKDLLVIRYEDMRKDPETVLGRVLAFMNADARQEEVADAVEYAAFSNMRKLEEKQVFQTKSRRLFAQQSDNASSFKVRRAKVGGFRDYFSDEQIAAIEEMIGQKLMRGFGYCPDETYSA